MSFYIYETHYVSKCLRCKENKPLEDQEFCESCCNDLNPTQDSKRAEISVEDLPY